MDKCEAKFNCKEDQDVGKSKRTACICEWWSQDGKIIFFDETVDKINVFYNWNFGGVTGQLWEQKTLLVLQYFCWGLFY